MLRSKLEEEQNIFPIIDCWKWETFSSHEHIRRLTSSINVTILRHREREERGRMLRAKRRKKDETQHHYEVSPYHKKDHTVFLHIYKSIFFFFWLWALTWSLASFGTEFHQSHHMRGKYILCTYAYHTCVRCKIIIFLGICSLFVTNKLNPAEEEV